MSTIPRQVTAIAAFTDINILRISNRIDALENLTVAAANTYIKRLGSRAKTATLLNSLDLRTRSLEQQTAPPRIDFDTRLAERMPLGRALASLHSRLIALGA
jgi:hypothetical protein